MHVSRTSLFRNALRALQSSTSTAATSPTKPTFFLATLPWRFTNDKDRFSVTEGARFADGDGVVASSISTSRRMSPVAGSLALKIGSIQNSGGAWLLMRADSSEHALDMVRQRVPGQGPWDVERATIQSVEGMNDDGREVTGPLFDPEATDHGSSQAVEEAGPLYGK